MKNLRESFNATGIPALYQAFREHTREVRREQKNFQRRIQWIADNEGLDKLEEKMDKEDQIRRRQFWNQFRGPRG
jgi:hypothetical protein